MERWLEEQPDKNGFGKLERLTIEAVKSGCSKPEEIFKQVSAADNPPQYWGDTTLWVKINELAERTPPILKIVPIPWLWPSNGLATSGEWTTFS